ncbi:hypothetical protein BpHYR1_030121 [Brachionus plicatilis]|uniref:Uncharacterized protein n=1 Tax=Brachionus plicatilis TaxID=10195 RepID=A0A3M7RM54_BRAPC|nr:hypothetical protein BpHYR1_030121 [Brachionus plicatilis]
MSLCPFKLLTTLPLLIFQIVIALSKDPEANSPLFRSVKHKISSIRIVLSLDPLIKAFDDKLTIETTSYSWPFRVFFKLPSIIKSAEELAKLPFSSSKSDRTVLSCFARFLSIRLCFTKSTEFKKFSFFFGLFILPIFINPLVKSAL